MEFRTPVEVKSNFKIQPHSKLLLLGSCFAESIGDLLSASKFNVVINPFGILYNPDSIVQCLTWLLDDKSFDASHLFEYQGVWNSFYHHSRFSSLKKEEMLSDINNALHNASHQLKKADYLVITLGTAWVYQLKSTGQIVSNCHKVQANEFNRYRMSVDDVVNRLSEVMNLIIQANPQIRIIFTVSPVRHIKDGLVENQLSKSTLVLAIHQLLDKYNQATYFPSYEILMDDLRDYRFYASDMVHPSDFAVNYIWEKFLSAYMEKPTIAFIHQIDKINKAVLHRPFQPGASSHQIFLKKQLELIEQVKAQYPFVTLDAEKKYFEENLC